MKTISKTKPKGTKRMTMFAMNEDNAITFCPTQKEVPADAIFQFASEKTLNLMSKEWTVSRLIEVYNGVPGVLPLKGFKKGRLPLVAKIWNAIQTLAGTTAEETASAAPQDAHSEAKPVKATKKASKAPKAERAPKAAKALKEKKAKTAKSDGEPKAPRDGSKTELVLGLLKRNGGVTLNELVKQTGWAFHTARGFISGNVGKKMGLKVESTKSEAGERTYAVA